jgi:enamine deaminase RidA (YjgF/YER057c/UK114 family)
MVTCVNPAAMKPPLSKYSHGTEVGPGARWLYVSGQTASAANGAIPTEFGEQVEQALASVAAVLQAAGMSKSDIVKLTVYVTLSGSEALSTYRALRDTWLEGHAPASTYLVVAALASPKLLVEIEAVAAGS